MDAHKLKDATSLVVYGETMNRDKAYTCADCGSVSWHLRRDAGVECAKCNSELLGVMWSTDIDYRMGRLSALKEMLAWVGTTCLGVNKKNMIQHIYALIAKEER